MIDLAFLEGIGWRDAVLVIAAVIGVYLTLAVMRLLQVAARRPQATRPAMPPAAPPEPPAAGPLARPSTPAPEFARELARSNVEADCQALRRECAQLREDLARLGEEVAQLKATRNTSPLYNEAMSLARQGMAAAGIAGRCGISIGEAELVAALARGANDFERNDYDKDRDERSTESGNRFRG